MYIDAARRVETPPSALPGMMGHTRDFVPMAVLAIYEYPRRMLRPYTRLVSLVGNPLPLCAPTFKELYRNKMGG